MLTLKNRQDVLAVNRACQKHVTPGFIVQIHARNDKEPARVGFTASKRVGNAVARNRAKRLLRQLARVTLSPQAKAGHDYVLIARIGIFRHNLSALQNDLSTILKKR